MTYEEKEPLEKGQEILNDLSDAAHEELRDYY